MGFNMPEPMKIRKNVANSFLVDQNMIKIGISTDYQRRKKDYKNTYYSEADYKSYVYELEKWETDLAIGDLQRFEKELKQEFIHANTQGEYYQKEYYEEIKAWIETCLKTHKISEYTSKEDKTLEKIRNKSIRDINAGEKMSKKKKPSKYENKRFIRTNKPISSKTASHNFKRYEWIAEAGSEGRSYSELNRDDSVYRKNIERKSYKGNRTKIEQDISYDIKLGMIEEK